MGNISQSRGIVGADLLRAAQKESCYGDALSVGRKKYDYRDNLLSMHMNSLRKNSRMKATSFEKNIILILGACGIRILFVPQWTNNFFSFFYLILKKYSYIIYR